MRKVGSFDARAFHDRVDDMVCELTGVERLP
jgi:hypothetical protein